MLHKNLVIETKNHTPVFLSAEQQKGREASQKRSPLDLIMNQFRRKTSSAERKKASVGRLFRSSESNDRKSEGIPETRETESSEEKDHVKLGTGSNVTFPC